MKLLLIAHHGDASEREDAYDLINHYRYISSHHVANTAEHVVNLDVVRARIPGCDALLVLPSRYDVPGKKDWEAARVEREAVLLAHTLGKQVGIIGRTVSLLRPYITMHADVFRLVGPLREQRDTTGGLADTFSKADIIPVGDTYHGAGPFMARFSAHVTRSSAA